MPFTLFLFLLGRFRVCHYSDNAYMSTISTLHDRYVEFNLLDSSREACAVCSLDMMCDADKWQAALGTALRELRAVAHFGITEDEMKRYVQSLRADAEQLAAQGDTVASGDQV